MKKVFLFFIPSVMSFALVSLSNQQNTTETVKPRNPWAIEYSHDDAYFAVGGDDSTLFIYNAENYSLYKKIKLSSAIKNLTWHSSGHFIAVATLKNIQFVDVKTGIPKTVTGVPGARGIAWNPNGDKLAVAGNGIVYIIGKDGNLSGSFEGPDRNSYLTVDWSVNNIITTGSDEIILFDLSGKQLSLIPHRKEFKTGVLTVRWHPSGDFFATGDYGHTKEGIPTNLQFRKKDGTLIRTVNGHHNEIRNIRWNNDGSLLATASDALRIYNSKGDLLATGITPSGYIIWSLGWSHDGKKIITSSFEADHIDIWSADGKHLQQLL